MTLCISVFAIPRSAEKNLWTIYATPGCDVSFSIDADSRCSQIAQSHCNTSVSQRTWHNLACVPYSDYTKSGPQPWLTANDLIFSISRGKGHFGVFKLLLRWANTLLCRVTLSQKFTSTKITFPKSSTCPVDEPVPRSGRQVRLLLSVILHIDMGRHRMESLQHALDWHGRRGEEQTS